MTTEVKTNSQMDKCINALALELPPSVWEDVNRRWQMYKKEKFDMTRFHHLNVKRSIEGFNCHKNVPVTFWTTALAGELGELCNMIKKIERVKAGGIDVGSSYTAATITPEMMMEEVGGIYIYLDLLCDILGINLAEAIVYTFNKKSEEHNLPFKYE